ncbi:MAG: hypothetical protein MJK10_21020 [Pseudomonadales bacterium]|nr:hypothetical protein [Pseudomonadales bacterium]NRA18481.1 hypothetical protein [Oceanospirillaceae bacterium]
MNIEKSSIDDAHFIQQLEQLQLDPKHFNHLGHLRLTWLYLQQYPRDIAITKVCQTINNYARHLNAPDKFHLSVTCTLVMIIAERINNDSNNKDWRAFINANSDLLENAIALVEECFSIDIFNCELARTQLVKADLHSFK